MTWRELIRRVSFVVNRDRNSDDLEEEMELHRQLRAEKLRQQGAAHDEAVSQAARQFGNHTLIRETSVNMWSWSWIDDLVKDLRHTVRVFVANPLFTIVAVLTLAVGIGANTAVFSVTNAVLFRTLPVHDARQLFFLHVEPGQPSGAHNTGNGNSSFSAHVFEELRRRGGNTVDLMAYVPLAIGKVAARTGSVPEAVRGAMVSGNFFPGVGVPATCGRSLTPADEKAHSAVVVLSYGFWSSRYQDDCSAVGRTMFIKGSPFTIVGVAAKEFTGLEGNAVDVWIPLQDRPEFNAWGLKETHFYASPTWWCLKVIARLAPGVTPAAAGTLLEPAFRQAAYQHLGGKPRDGERPRTITFVPAIGVGDSSGSLETPLYVLLAMVAVVLIIACGNVSMLLAARNAARRREFSVRMAIGGSRGRLLRQLLAESALLVAAGALLGWMLAEAATGALAKWLELEISLSPDGTVLMFTLAVSAAAALVFGIAPMFTIANTPVAATLKNSVATAFRERSTVRSARAVVAVQVALCLILLVTAGLFARTLRNLENADYGVRSKGLLVFGVNPQLGNSTKVREIRFYEGLMGKLRSVPGIESVTLVGNRPGSGWSNNTTAIIDGRDPRSHGITGPGGMRWNNVGPDFFTTMGIPLRQGRDFTTADSAESARVAVVNETFVRRFFNGREALGHQVSYTGKHGFTVVGVAANSKYTRIREEDLPMAWFPYTQVADVGAMHVEVRAAGDPSAFWPLLRRAVAEYAPDLPLLDPATQQAEFEGSLGQERLLANLAVCFGGLALLLVATGLYGTLAYSVRRRTSELGIRMAIGAQRRDVLWMILRESLLIALAGAAVGLPLTYVLTRGLGSMLYGLAPHDPLTLAGGIVGIGVVTLLASLIPAMRAASMDPVIALRYE